MKSFEIISHTADAEIAALGTTLEELFPAALEGMNEMLKPGFCKDAEGGTIEKEVEISAADATLLLVDFLSEILTASHEEKAVFCRAEFKLLDETSLQAVLRGARTSAFGRDIKAVTYHKAEIRKNEKGNWETHVVFDV